MHFRGLSLLSVLLALTFTQLACVPQDCIGGSFEVGGMVVDQNGNPLPNAQITITHERGYSKPFRQTLFSDIDGRFTSELFFMFACETVTIEVDKEGYSQWSGEYYGPFEGFPDELPENLTIELVSE